MIALVFLRRLTVLAGETSTFEPVFPVDWNLLVHGILLHFGAWGRRSRTHTCTRVKARAYTHTHTHTRTHARQHTHTHARTYKHTHSLSPSLSLSHTFTVPLIQSIWPVLKVALQPLFQVSVLSGRIGSKVGGTIVEPKAFLPTRQPRRKEYRQWRTIFTPVRHSAAMFFG